MNTPQPSPVDILLVDDNPGKLLALETALAPLGQRIVCAHSGCDALRQLLARQFATIILDVNMPDMDGFETAQMIRARSRTAHTPIIFVSAVNLDSADALRGYSLGAVDYICAPIIPEVLRAKVAVFVELHRKSEEAERHARELEERTRELEHSQRQLQLSERMAVLGTLCAGLGHDMGNLLLPINIRLQTMDTEGLSAETRECMESIRTCVSYLQRLTIGLRQLALDSRTGGSPGETVAIHEWWDETAPILRNALPRSVMLEFDAAQELRPVRIARHQLTQAVFNLVQNAGEALKPRGSGTVRIWASKETAGEGVRIGVSDNGPGMAPEVLRRCFDPFFTTKTRSLSTGLGLALVHGIAQNAGSAVDVVSAPGEGATFSFVLPAAPSDRSTANKQIAVVSLHDARVRGYAMSLARSAGFEVVETSRPEDPRASIWIADMATLRISSTGAACGDAAGSVLAYQEANETIPEGVLPFTVEPGPTSLRERLREIVKRRAATTAGRGQLA